MILASKYPKLLEIWDFEKNIEDPYKDKVLTANKYWWKCGICYLSSEQELNSKCQGTKCPYCAGQKINIENSILITHPEIAKEYDRNKNSKNIESIGKGSKFRAYWICSKCNSSYKTMVFNRIRFGCPYCSGNKVNSTNNLIVTHPDLINEWDRLRNADIPENYSYGSNNSVYWVCNKFHSWKASIKSRAIIKNGCPICAIGIQKSKAEKEWLDYLNIPEEYRGQIIKINNKRFNLDALDNKTNTIYEFYGNYWHGNPAMYNSNDMNWTINKTHGQVYDETVVKREKLLRDAGYNLVTIWESDWNKIKLNKNGNTAT